MSHFLNTYLSTNLEDYDNICLPMHKSMRDYVYKHRKREKYQRGDKYYYHDSEIQFGTWLKRFLEKSIGKDFDFVFRKVREKFNPTLEELHSTPLTWLYWFVDKYEKPIHYYQNYYFDKNNILRRYKVDKKKKTIKVVQKTLTPYYRILKINWRVDDYIEGVLGWKRYAYVMSTGGYINSVTAQRVKYTLTTYGINPEKYVVPVYKNNVYYLEKGSRECYRYLAELKKSKKKYRRELNKEIEEENNQILHKIEAKRREQEEQLNIVTRDRLGFNEESFIGEPYHGQKRKKKIR